MLTSSEQSSGTGLPTAEIRLVDGVHYRRDAFAEGLRLSGYIPILKSDHPPRLKDVLILWNRYPRDEHRARLYEARGNHVIITENAWLGPEEKEKHLFALCRGHHNGAGTWAVGPDDRWGNLLETPRPWRSSGTHILVLPQRGMGERGIAMDKSWTQDVIARLRQKTKRPIKVRTHPGVRPHPPIDFSDCWAAVTWGSGAAIKALVAGIPVFYEFPNWIGASAARYGIDDVEDCFLGDRGPMFHRLSWATWSADEIAKGIPFTWLLR